MNQLFESHFFVYTLILFGYTCLSHGLILFNDGLYWDAWMVDSWQRRKDWPIMKRYLSEVGMPIMYYVYKLNSFFPNRIFASKFLAFISIFISSVQVYLIATYFHFLNPEQALLLSLLFLSYTGYHMLVDTVVGLQYTFPIAVFYSAVFLAFYAHSQEGTYSMIAHILAIILFFWSFNANSILVYYFGFLGLSILFQVNGSLLDIFSFDVIFHNLVYAIIPFIYWFIKEKYTPRHGYCVEYNKISINLPSISRGIFHAVRYTLESAVVKPISFMVRNRLLIIALILIIIFNIFFILPIRVDKSIALVLIALGSLLFILAVIPYILVGQPINDNGWATKNAMLIHLPSGMLLLGGISFLITDPFIFQSIILFYLISTCLYNMRNALYYLAVFVKDYSWLYKIKNKSELEGVSVFQVVDNHYLKGDFANKSQDYKPVYLVFMFDWLWKNGPKRIGISEFEPRKSYTKQELAKVFESTTIPYALNKIDIDSRQVRITIKNNDSRPFYINSLKYIKARKINKNESELNKLLENMTSIDVDFLD